MLHRNADFCFDDSLRRFLEALRAMLPEGKDGQVDDCRENPPGGLVPQHTWRSALVDFVKASQSDGWFIAGIALDAIISYAGGGNATE
jgi:hypothetical protein